MSEISITGIKSNSVDNILDFANQYFSQFDLSLVRERIGDITGKFATGSKSFSDLGEYDEKEIKPCLERGCEFTTNFNLFTNIKENPGWIVFSFPIRLADITLSIDEDFTVFISEKLSTSAFDLYEYTVVDQVIIRGYKNGSVEDKLFISGEGQLDDAEGYFEKLEGLDREDLNEEEVETKADIIAKFWDHIRYSPTYLDSYDINSRIPLYLKGNSENILKFLSGKKKTFYFV